MINSKIFFDGVFLSIYSHFLEKLERSKLCKKKLWGSINPENGLFQKSHPIKKINIFFVPFLLQDNSHSCLDLKFQVSKSKIVIEVTNLSIWPQKCVFLKRL